MVIKFGHRCFWREGPLGIYSQILVMSLEGGNIWQVSISPVMYCLRSSSLKSTYFSWIAAHRALPEGAVPVITTWSCHFEWIICPCTFNSLSQQLKRSTLGIPPHLLVMLLLSGHVALCQAMNGLQPSYFDSRYTFWGAFLSKVLVTWLLSCHITLINNHIHAVIEQ